jgi:hypothetical protein
VNARVRRPPVLAPWYDFRDHPGPYRGILHVYGVRPWRERWRCPHPHRAADEAIACARAALAEKIAAGEARSRTAAGQDTP